MTYANLQRFADAPDLPTHVRPVKFIYEQDLCAGIWVRDRSGRPIRFDNHEPVDRRGNHVDPWGKGDCPVYEARLDALCDRLVNDGVTEVILNYESGPMDLTDPAGPLGILHLWVHLEWVIGKFNRRGIRVIAIYNDAMWGGWYDDDPAEELSPARWVRRMNLRPLIKFNPIRSQADANETVLRGARWTDACWTPGLIMLDPGAFDGGVAVWAVTLDAAIRAAGENDADLLIWADGGRPQDVDGRRVLNPMKPETRAMVEMFFGRTAPATRGGEG